MGYRSGHEQAPAHCWGDGLSVDAIIAGQDAMRAAGKGDAAESARLDAERDYQSALMALKEPLPEPEKVYHPKHIVWKREKDSDEFKFVSARGTTDNLELLAAAYGVKVRYNELSRETEISVGGRVRNGELSRNSNLTLLEDLCRINSYPHTQVAGNIHALAERDTYNPAAEWIKSKPWDRQPRLDDLFSCLTLADPTKAQTSWALFRKWILGAVAILTRRAEKFEHVLVLVDPNGGIGKTRFFNTLCPREFQADGVTLETDNKDSVLQVVSKWLVELGEIGATFNRSDIEALKAFLSRSSDEVRPPYARAANQYPRRTAFFGSVNNVRFLVDDTNNRRFWPIEVTAVDYQHKIDMQQVWAEALAWIDRGDIWHLTPDENRAVGEYNEAFRSMDRVEELIRSLYDTGATPCRYLSASQVLEEVGIVGAKVGDMRKAGAILRQLYAHTTQSNVAKYHMPYARGTGRHLTPVRSTWADGPL